jgi:hypothetical protein
MMSRPVPFDKFLCPLLCSVLLCTNAVAAGITRDTDWWVVLGSFPDPDLSAPQEAKIASVRGMAARCGFDPFNDFSNKFRGFTPGYDVVVVGAFASKSKARAALDAVRRCVPGAYIKFGKHLGE